MKSNSRLHFERSAEFGKRLEALIPGGAHTYSKGRDQFPTQAPNGIVRGKGCWLWDQDDNRLVDWGMGLTSVTLGHACDAVDDRVCAEIRKGVNFARPAALELEAAEALLAAIGIDGMVKFAKHGSTVTTAAVKLARAFTGKAVVACPIEQPFFSFDDWFIGTTAADFGIPDDFKRYTARFRYGDLDDLARVFKQSKDDVACVIMEPMKFHRPPEGYLQAVKELCHAHGALLIVDEMVSGCKWAVGGQQDYFGVQGDLSTWGKGIANGYGCTALVGRADIMRLGGIDDEGARKLFLISTTHGAESSGLAAMIATLDYYARHDVIRRNWALGESLKARLQTIIDELDMAAYLRLTGDPCLFVMENFGADGQPDLALRTYWMQEMIARGICSQGLFMPTPAHDEEAVNLTLDAFREAGLAYGDALTTGVAGKLVGPAIKPVFRKHV